MRNLWPGRAYPGFPSGSAVSCNAEQSAARGDPSIMEGSARVVPQGLPELRWSEVAPKH
jgi:hypothetical protein